MKNGHRFYDHFILPNKNPAGISDTTSAKGEKLGNQPATGLDLNIPHIGAFQYSHRISATASRNTTHG